LKRLWRSSRNCHRWKRYVQHWLLFPDWKGISRSRRQSRLPPSSRHGTHHCKEDLAFSAEDITPETVVDGFGNRTLAESPTLGGIDDGDRSFKRPKKHDAEESGADAEDGENLFPPDADEESDEEDQDEESNGVAGMTAPDLTEDELERRKDEQLAAREDKRQQLAENRKERQRTRRRNEMAQAVARATVRDSKESLSESE
jgi:hypothetical protein